MRNKNVVNNKDLAKEINYGYLNINLEKLNKAIKNKDKEKIKHYKDKVEFYANILDKLNYWEGEYKCINK